MEFKQPKRPLLALPYYIIACLRVPHKDTLSTHAYCWTSLVAQSRYFILAFIQLEWDHPAKLLLKAAATWKK